MWFSHENMSDSSTYHNHNHNSILNPEECHRLYHSQQQPNKVLFVDGSWHMPNSNRNARVEYEKGPRLPGALFFDVDDIASTGVELNPKSLPHMMPPVKLFGLAMDALGVGEEDVIIVYAARGCFAAPRTWFTFRAMGHDPDKVYIMNGGIDDWVRLGERVDCEPVIAMQASDLDMREEVEPVYSCAKEPSQIVDIDYVTNVVNSTMNNNPLNDIIFDARSPGRFAGTEPEPRKGIRGGHMPGSKNMFFLQFHDSSDPLKFQSKEKMNDILNSYGIDEKTCYGHNIISSCGTGITACSLVLAMVECRRNIDRTFVYDGSWTEWGDPNSGKPVVK